MQIIRETLIDFAGKRKIALALSGALLLAGILSILFQGFKTNIDFTGGTELQYKFSHAITEGALRDALDSGGVSAEVTSLSSEDAHPEWMVKIQDTELESAPKTVGAIFASAFPENAAELRARNTIGPRVGEELKWDATWSILWAMFFIVIYITIRFEFMYAVGALLALVHDVLMTLGIFSIFGIEISLPIIAALLTIVGYSLNDTIVVYDRIRENVKKLKGTDFVSTINVSINQTLSRTLLTSMTTLMVVGVLFVFGGTTLHNMVFALMLGVIIGTYSSIFVASPVLIEWHARALLRQKAGK
jgi:preprotein translocase subunit SecF